MEARQIQGNWYTVYLGKDAHAVCIRTGRRINVSLNPRDLTKISMMVNMFIVGIDYIYDIELNIRHEFYGWYSVLNDVVSRRLSVDTIQLAFAHTSPLKMVSIPNVWANAHTVVGLSVRDRPPLGEHYLLVRPTGSVEVNLRELIPADSGACALIFDSDRDDAACVVYETGDVWYGQKFNLRTCCLAASPKHLGQLDPDCKITFRDGYLLIEPIEKPSMFWRFWHIDARLPFPEIVERDAKLAVSLNVATRRETNRLTGTHETLVHDMRKTTTIRLKGIVTDVSSDGAWVLVWPDVGPYKPEAVRLSGWGRGMAPRVRRLGATLRAAGVGRVMPVAYWRL